MSETLHLSLAIIFSIHSRIIPLELYINDDFSSENIYQKEENILQIAYHVFHSSSDGFSVEVLSTTRDRASLCTTILPFICTMKLR